MQIRRNFVVILHCSTIVNINDFYKVGKCNHDVGGGGDDDDVDASNDVDDKLNSTY